MAKERDGTPRPLYVIYNNLMTLLNSQKDGMEGKKYKDHLDKLIRETVVISSPMPVRIDAYCAQRNIPLWEFRARPIREQAEMLALAAIQAMQDILDRSNEIQNESMNKK